MGDPSRPDASDTKNDPAEDEAEDELQREVHDQDRRRPVAREVLRYVREGEDRAGQKPSPPFSQPSDEPALEKSATQAR